MNTKELVLSVANGQMSASRIARIIKSFHGIEIKPKTVAQICQEENIATPARVHSDNPIERTYPDIWSVRLEAISFWDRVRRYWGDNIAKQLFSLIQSSGVDHFRGLYLQFADYITPAIIDRKNINLDAVQSNPIEPESLYSVEEIKSAYLVGFERSFALDPSAYHGAKFPLATPDWHEFKKTKFIQDSIDVANKQLPTDRDVMEYFAKFWDDVRNRGDYYFENLRHSLCGSAEQPLSQRPFYSATQKHFRHFLHNLNGFRKGGPWRVVMLQDPNLPLPMLLEGLLHRYGWQKLESLVAIGMLISAPEQLDSNAIDRIDDSV